MSHEIFMTIQIVGMCFITYLMGYMVGANRGHRDATAAWKAAYENKQSLTTLFLSVRVEGTGLKNTILVSIKLERQCQ